MNSKPLTGAEARQHLYELMHQDTSFEEKAYQALELGVRCLGVQNGHLTRIDTETDYWEITVSTDPPGGQFPPGLELDLETTYCRRTLTADGSIALHDAPRQGWEDDPAFEEHGLQCYHGTTLAIDGEPYGTVCFVATDSREESFGEIETMFAEFITRLLERELEREQHEADLTRQANLVNVLNRVLRHNLRNDLSVVRGHARLLMDQTDDETHGDVCLEAVDDLIELSEQARELERIVGEDYDRQDTDIVALVEYLIDKTRRNFPDVSFILKGDGAVTAAVRPSFERALEELLENAAKHAGETPTVTVTVEAVPNAVEIRIADDGPGLGEAERKVLASGTETPLIHGSGLGLWLVHWIVSGHNGAVTPETTPEGTIMTLSVPRSPEETLTQQVTELRQARDRYQAAFENAFEGMVIVDDDARIVAANPEAADIYGPDRQELLGRSIREFLPDEFDFEAAWDAFKAAGTERDTVTIVGTDGVERPVEYAATADIVPGQHLTTVRDISDRVGRERERAQAETIFEQAQDAMFLIDVTDGTFRVECANDAYEGLTGLSTADIRGKTPAEILGAEVGAEIEARYSECVERRETVEYEEIIPIDGESRYWETKLSPIIEDDAVVKLVGTTRDVTDQKQREEQLREKRERFERLLETSPVGITVLDTDGAIVRANDRAEEILALSKSEITTRTYDDPDWEIVDAAGEPIPAEALPFRRVLETGKPVYEYEHGIRLADGSFRWLSINAAPLTSREGEIEQVVSVITDRTDHYEDERHPSLQ
jgi:PAS domain S-box-containing protein